MTNIAYIYQPHYKTNMFRVSVNKQQGPEVNYIVVTCSPNYNGVWKYDSSLHKKCGRWTNGNTICYEIPISSCKYVKSIQEVKNPDIIRKIREQQREWVSNSVKNNYKKYTKLPDWLI